jgi:enoyl-CoA hydratase/carnithine racemase
MNEFPIATIAIVRGLSPTGKLPSPAETFDLVAQGNREEIETRIAAWLEAFRQAPQAATVLTRLVRHGQSSLHMESMSYSTLQAGPEFRTWLSKRTSRRIPEPGERLRITEGSGFWLIVLNRPATHNAIDARMREELCDILDAALEARVAVGLRGEGKTFSSGGDLNEFGLLNNPVDAHFVRSSRSVASRLLELQDRLVAAVHGSTVGGGIELAAFARHVIAAKGTTFRLPEVQYGLLPGAGGTLSILRRIGRRNFLDIALTGRLVGCEEAMSIGLVDEIVDLGMLEARTRDVLSGLG